MDKYFDITRRREFKALLLELAKTYSLSEERAVRSEFYLKFEELYYINNQGILRHFYSDIFSTLIEINSDPSLDKGDIDLLGMNLFCLARGYKAMNHDDAGNLIDIRDNLWKLYDHVSLDIARIQYSNSGDDRLSHELQFEIVSEQIVESKNKLKTLSDETDKLKNDLSKAQLDYIAILGIFASIVLAFVGALAFSTSVLENIDSVSVYRLLLTALIIGVVFVTIIFLMFHYVGVMSWRTSSTNKPNSPLIIAYVFFGIMICAVIAAWCNGCVESRNDRIESDSEQSTTAEIVESTSDPDTTDSVILTESEQQTKTAES